MLKAHLINEPMQTFELCLDDFGGEFYTQPLLSEKGSHSVAEFLPAAFAGSRAEGFELFDSKGVLVQKGEAEDSFSFGKKSSFTLKVFLGEEGVIRLACTIGIGTDIGTGNAWPRLNLPLKELDKLFSDNRVINVKITIGGTQAMWRKLYPEAPDGSAYGYYELPAEGSAEVVISRGQWQELKNAGKDLSFVIFNTGETGDSEGAEAFSVYIDGLEAVQTDCAASLYVSTASGYPKLEIPLEMFETLFADPATASVKFTVDGTNASWHRVYIEAPDLSAYAENRLEAGKEAELPLTRAHWQELKNAGETLLRIVINNTGDGTDSGANEAFTVYAKDLSAVRLDAEIWEHLNASQTSWPRFSLPLTKFDEVFEDDAVTAVTFTVGGTNASWHKLYTETPAKGAYGYYRLETGEGVEISLTKTQWQELKDAGKTELSIVIHNGAELVDNGAKESFRVYASGLKTVK